MFPRRALALSLCVLAGAAAALLLMPRIVRASRDDTSRLCAILDALRSSLDALRSRPAPRLALFGNSAGMFGVDTRVLGGWNLCSPAQTLSEALLLQQELPRNVTIVVQLVTQSQLAAEVPVEPDHYNAMLLCGYTPQAETRDTIARLFGVQLEVRPLRDRLYARRHVRAAIEGFARDFLRRDRSRVRLTHDLYFPGAASGPPAGWLPEQRFASLLGDRYVVREPQVRLLRESSAVAARHGRRYLVVLAPIHPRLRTSPLACPKGLDCIDLTHLLDEREFQDPTHATHDGARKLTGAIRDALTARRLLSE